MHNVSLTRTRVWAGAFLLALAPIAGATAQSTFPDKPIRLYVPFPAGGAADTLGRMLASSLNDELKQSVIVENRAGAGGTIGTTTVARAAADGYTLLLGNVSTLATAASLYPNLPYDPQADFTPMTLVGHSPLVFSVNASQSIEDLPALITQARDNPGTLDYGSSGAGSITHLTGEMLNAQTDDALVHIPYKGSPPVVMAVVSGELDIGVTQVAEMLPQQRAGHLRALAITGEQRLEAIPDVPTAAELGIDGLDATTWYAVVGPKGIPEEVMAVLQPALVKALDNPDIKQRFASEGLIIESSSADELAALIADEVPRWADVVEKAGVQLN